MSELTPVVKDKLTESQVRDLLTLVDYVEDDLGRSTWATLTPADEDYTAEDAARDAATRLADAFEHLRVKS